MGVNGWVSSPRRLVDPINRMRDMFLLCFSYSEYSTSLYLFRSCFKSTNENLHFSLYVFYFFLLKFIPRHFITLETIVNRVYFHFYFEVVIKE